MLSDAQVVVLSNPNACSLTMGLGWGAAASGSTPQVPGSIVLWLDGARIITVAPTDGYLLTPPASYIPIIGGNSFLGTVEATAFSWIFTDDDALVCLALYVVVYCHFLSFPFCLSPVFGE